MTNRQLKCLSAGLTALSAVMVVAYWGNDVTVGMWMSALIINGFNVFITSDLR